MSELMDKQIENWVDMKSAVAGDANVALLQGSVTAVSSGVANS
jgi:hypothetical protein